MAVKFNTFTGIAFAGLEILPETLQDRSLGLPLQKATREEKPEHLPRHLAGDAALVPPVLRAVDEFLDGQPSRLP